MTNDLTRLLNTETDLSPIANTFREELLNDDSDSVAGRKIVEAIAANDTDALCIALTGWSAKDLLVRAGLLEDDEDIAPNGKKACAVTQLRVRREGYNVETYTTSVYLVVSTGTIITESLLRRVFTDIVKEFMNTVEGQQAWENTAHDFNWGDWATEIPEAILNKHGVYRDCPPLIKTTEQASFAVDQDEIIGYGIDEMPEDAQNAYWDEFSNDLWLLGVDYIGNAPEKFDADNSDLKKLRSRAFCTYLRSAIEEYRPSAETLKRQSDCAGVIWDAYHNRPM